MRPPPGSLFTEMPAEGPSAAFGPDTFAQGSFPRRTLVEIRITGIIKRFYADNAIWDAARRGQLAYRYGPGGIMDAATFQCVGTVVVVFESGFYLPCSRNGMASDTQVVWTDTVVVQGSGWVTRNHVPDPSATLRCGDVFPLPCFTYEGQQEASVRPVADKLVVEADSTTVGSGSVVTFTARRRDEQPVTVAGWTWVVDTTAAAVPGASACAGATAECSSVLTYGQIDSLPQVGIMYARAEIGGVDEVAGVAVTVRGSGPPPGDSGGGGNGCPASSAPSGGALRVGGEPESASERDDL
ncbi:MAG: hypothetical protein ACRD08_09060, partial [Acidimicrobiales bacterium]